MPHDPKEEREGQRRRETDRQREEERERKKLTKAFGSPSSCNSIFHPLCLILVDAVKT
jgi:hypothetical protein